VQVAVENSGFRQSLQPQVTEADFRHAQAKPQEVHFGQGENNVQVSERSERA